MTAPNEKKLEDHEVYSEVVYKKPASSTAIEEIVEKTRFFVQSLVKRINAAAPDDIFILSLPLVVTVAFLVGALVAAGSAGPSKPPQQPDSPSGFADVSERLSNIDQRLKAFDERFETLRGSREEAGELDRLESRVKELDDKLEAFLGRLRKATYDDPPYRKASNDVWRVDQIVSEDSEGDDVDSDNVSNEDVLSDEVAGDVVDDEDVRDDVVDDGTPSSCSEGESASGCSEPDKRQLEVSDEE